MEEELYQFQAETRHEKKYYFFTKDLLDRLLSAAALLYFLPLLILIMIMIWLDSPGPVIYKQERVGKNGKTFWIFKLRTMKVDAEKGGPQWTSKTDVRITRVGRFLRQTRMDEIPQLVNVIRGEMSLVGPRPERAYFIEEFEKTIPEFSKRLTVKPGLTGWAQINGGYEISPAEKLKLDLYYIKRCSLLFDFKTIVKTIPVILFAKGAR